MQNQFVDGTIGLFILLLVGSQIIAMQRYILIVFIV